MVCYDKRHLKPPGQEKVRISIPGMTSIINLSIETSEFPASYKHSQIIPLKKRPSLSNLDCASYCPVNLLPIHGKVLQKAIFNQLVLYLEENKPAVQAAGQTLPDATSIVGKILPFSKNAVTFEPIQRLDASWDLESLKKGKYSFFLMTGSTIFNCLTVTAP